MKTLATLLILFTCTLSARSQENVFQGVTVEEIIENYEDAIGGREAWMAISGEQITSKLDINGAVMESESITLKDGRSLSKSNFNGVETINEAFDGEVLWGYNNLMKPYKKLNDELKNTKQAIKYFPDILLTYKEAGLSLEIVGEEMINNQNCYKLKLIGKKVFVKGKEYDSEETYYISKETWLVVGLEMKNIEDGKWGKMIMILNDDFKNVDGLIVAHTSIMNHPDWGEIKTTVEKVVFNPVVNDEDFIYPGK